MTDYRDNMTIGEIKANDLAMAEDAIRGCKRYAFDHSRAGKEAAYRLMGTAVDATLKRLGIVITPQTTEAKVEKKLREKEVQVEDRGYYKGDKSWRNGIYIYQRGELVAFISALMESNPAPSLLCLPQSVKTDKSYAIYTNAKLDDKYISSGLNLAPIHGRTLCHGGGSA